MNEGNKTMIESEETELEEITVPACMNNNRFGKRVIMVAWIELAEDDEQEEGDSFRRRCKEA